MIWRNENFSNVRRFFGLPITIAGPGQASRLVAEDGKAYPLSPPTKDNQS